MPSGVEVIAAERERQVSEEGWSSEHDDTHDDGSLARAAGAYVLQARGWWPHEWGEPPVIPGPDRVRELAKAGALIAAEIDRLQRAGRKEVT